MCCGKAQPNGNAVMREILLHECICRHSDTHTAMSPHPPSSCVVLNRAQKVSALIYRALAYSIKNRLNSHECRVCLPFCDLRNVFLKHKTNQQNYFNVSIALQSQWELKRRKGERWEHGLTKDIAMNSFTKCVYRCKAQSKWIRIQKIVWQDCN